MEETEIVAFADDSYLEDEEESEDDPDIDYTTLISFIDYKIFKEMKSFPRSPQHKDLLCNLESIDRDNSLLIFVSHCWLRGWSGSEGYDGNPHPDNCNADKFKLCTQGIEHIIHHMAPGTKECYVWLDFACINQDDRKGLPKSLKRYDKIVECCDLIFTPIVDLNRTWQPPANSVNMLADYKAPLWNDGPHAYLNRAWCRMEMLYAAHIPLLPNSQDAVERHTLFRGGLAHACQNNRRPHMVYGHGEIAGNIGPRVLPPLSNSYFFEFDPMEGSLSVEEDRYLVYRLIKRLLPYMLKNTIPPGYEGDLNEAGQPHGRGKSRTAEGCTYEGEWVNGMMHGIGKAVLSDGDVYEGEWKENLMEGNGVYSAAGGEVYRGQFKNNLFEGKGVMLYTNGEYEGDFHGGMKHGHGRSVNSEGDVYEGEWRNDLKEGRGVMRYVDGSVFEGEWRQGEKSGPGRLSLASGQVMEGVCDQDAFQGGLKVTLTDGTVHYGEASSV